MYIKTSILSFELKIFSRKLQNLSISIMNTKKFISSIKTTKVKITLYVLYFKVQFGHLILTLVFNKYSIYFVIY